MNYIYSIYFLAFNSGFYSGFSKFALSMWLRDGGATLMLLNLFSWTLLPGTLSAFWLPFLENYDCLIFKFGLKKNIIICCDFLLLSLTCILPFFNIKNLNGTKQFLLIIFLIVYASIVATRDAISIGYKMEFIKKNQLPEYDGFISAYYQTGMLISTAGLLQISEYISWSTIFSFICVWLLLTLLLDALMQNSSYIQQKKLNLFEKFSKPFVDLIRLNKKIIYYLLAFLVFYNLADRMLVGNLNYYVLDSGLTKTNLSSLKIVAGILSILVGYLNVYITRIFGIEKMLIIGSLLYSSVPLVIITNHYFSIFSGYSNKIFFIVTYMLDKIFKIIQGTAFFSYQMQFCNVEVAASQRALFTFFERGFCTLMAPVFGFILTYYGYNMFFLMAFLTVIPSLISVSLLILIRSKNNEKTDS